MKFVLPTWIALILLGLVFLVVPGCGDDDDDDDDNSDDDDDDDDDNGDDDDEENPFGGAEKAIGVWTWVDVQGAICRDEQPTGLGVRLQEGADSVMIFLQGGGSCHDLKSCQNNPAHGTQEDFDLWVAGEHSVINGSGSQGIFHNSHDDNPIAGWDVVLVPYCTGDHHAGLAENVLIDGLDDPQQFVGYRNLTKYMDIVVPYFAGVKKVLLAGDSAGGLGVVFTYLLVAEAFDPIPVYLLDDSGPLVRDDVLIPCWQQLIRDLYNMGTIIPEACTACNLPDGGGMSNLMAYLPQAYPAGRFGLFSSDGDEVFREELGHAQNNCQGDTPLTHDAYREALIDLRDNVLQPTGKWGTFYRDGVFHTAVLEDITFYDFHFKGYYLTEWVADLLEGNFEDIGP